MDVFLERCAGLDVHQAGIVCCVLIGAPGRKPQKLQGRFGTTTRELEALRAWLAEHCVTHVGMESTGVYWKPVYAVLEGHVDLTVGNAHHMPRPGRQDLRATARDPRLARDGALLAHADRDADGSMPHTPTAACWAHTGCGAR